MKVKNFIKFAIPAVCVVFVFLCSRISALADWYMRICYPSIAAVLSFFSRLIPFSLLDVMIVVAIVLLSGSIVMLCRKRLSFYRWGKLLALFILWIVVWFYMAWGVGYFRYDFFERFGIKSPVEDREFFEAFVVRYIDSLNRAYVADFYFDAEDIDREIETLYKKHHLQLCLPYPCGWRRTKKTMTEPLMTRMGIAGFFAPFFNEIQVNNYALPLSYPHTLAHEKAHQFGIASEAECNLYATVICTSSDHPLVRYSGYLMTVSYMLSNLRKISPENYREIYEQIEPNVLADYRAIREHWRKALNPTMSAIQDKVYDTYLKTNKQQSGVLSYSEMTGLLLAWEKLNEKNF